MVLIYRFYVDLCRGIYILRTSVRPAWFDVIY